MAISLKHVSRARKPRFRACSLHVRLFHIDLKILILTDCFSLCYFPGRAYGCGVYFARDASYSVRYARGGGEGRYMYLARVLVGQYCQGNSGMIVPPPKNPSRPEILYESVVDSTENPSIFVVFYDAQCYPEYLITF